MGNEVCKFWANNDSQIKLCAAGIIREKRGELNYTKEICQTEKFKDCPHFIFRNGQKERRLKNVAENV